METNDFDLLWNETIRQLAEDKTLTEQERNMWFLNTKPVRGDHSVIVLSVPSKFIRDQVMQRYTGILESKLHDLTGSHITISFEIQESSSQAKSKEKVIVPKKKERKPHSQLREDYTFDRFVIGGNNKFAASAAQAISHSPGEMYNPFFIYGGVGLGKTHLMQSIGNYIHSAQTNKKVVYITAETFVNEFINSIKTETQNRFKNKYRKIDVLLIDDIHDLQNKKETQEEVFHTFNTLYDTKKQMVFTCDRPPSELRNLTDRLKSRFDRGLNVDLQPPDFETRFAIIKKKQENYSTQIPDDVLELICRNITSNIRDLESSLTKIVAYADLVGKEINIEVAQQQLKGSFTSNLGSNVTIPKVQKIISEYFNVTPSDLKGKKRTQKIVFPRQVAMFIIREVTDYSTTEIGLEFGGRDHTTVMHSCQKIEDRMKADPTLEPTINGLIRSVRDNG